MADDPGSLVTLFAGGEFGYYEAKNARLVGISEVKVVENIIRIPEIGVDGDDAKTFLGSMSVCAVVLGGIVGF